MKFNSKHLGYTLIEAMIALTVLSTSIIVSISIITSSADSENLNRDLLIGSQLADEGVQIVINLYQTNLLRFGQENITSCALMLPEFDEGPDMCISSGESRIGTGNYFVAMEPINNDLIWNFDIVGADLIIDDVINEAYKLYIYTDSNNTSFYTGKIDGSTASDFYRNVEIEELDTGININSKVSWKRSGGFVTTREYSYLINFN